MGYITNYSLEVKKYGKQEEEKNISIEDVENKIKNNASQDEVLELLNILKKGQTKVKVTSKMVINELRNFSEGANYAFDEKGSTQDGCKWYDHDDDFLKFSKSFPDWLFILKGEGEESGDVWKKYYLNGKKQEAKAKISFDDFDEKKLV
jgi:hypothetical protein